MQLTFIIFFLLFYALGSLPTGLIIGKLTQKKDLRFTGSCNIGATNASRILGAKWGIVVFLCDFLKGLIPTLICLHNKTLKDSVNESHNPNIAVCLLIILPILGHMFSIFNKLKGGKAIATSVGVITAINPLIGFLGILFFLLFLRFFGYASLASIIATLLVNLLLGINFIFNDDVFTRIPNIQDNKGMLYFFIISITCVVILKHYSNIVRLWQGKEYKFTFSK
ncbi:acyl-phosphate glycerol-3-phosphate O-acyltransferase PlsY [Candidatus Phytoplasma solani]|uniref:glycerol-3-phosphate 1-O-acyltransferase PlsY n=1 Tax=Candidatus Phytoplasma solani TaxID=69896 RepID=UPI0032DA9662